MKEFITKENNLVKKNWSQLGTKKIIIILLDAIFVFSTFICAFIDYVNDGRFFGYLLALSFVGIGILVILPWGHRFTTYEKTWFLTILVLASIFSILFPEEDMHGIKGVWIMALYLLNTFLNILCELLIAKQSKWNFIVSVFVELSEILIYGLLAYRFATMAVTIFFWLPIDVLSFIAWHRHPDKYKNELTQVRTLTGKQEVLIIIGIIVWTVVVGYILTLIDLGSELFHGNDKLEIAVCYIDACVSAVGIANGIFILFRIREQWVAWFIYALLEGVINILAGQYVLLISKLGYLTNTTYGYIRWTKYIKENPEMLIKGEDLKLKTIIAKTKANIANLKEKRAKKSA
ncbi:MAG: nicotinamide mononucleotide transporter [Ruminococcaceae bacterium]|nr:nicotinamide mononucleotide transporter [Oscillospiraceae bacterium]